jgi:hypothetical protein
MTTGDRLLLGQGAVDQVQLEYGVARPKAEARTANSLQQELLRLSYLVSKRHGLPDFMTLQELN